MAEGSSTPTDEGPSFFIDQKTPLLASPVTVIDGKATPRAVEDCEMPFNEDNHQEHLPAAVGQPRQPLHVSDDEPFKLRCMICHEKTANPVMLPCLDIFCLPCLEKQFVQQQDKHGRASSTPRSYHPELPQLHEVNDDHSHPISTPLRERSGGNPPPVPWPPRYYKPRHPPTPSDDGEDHQPPQSLLPPSVSPYNTVDTVVDSSRPQPSGSPTNPANQLDNPAANHDPTGDGLLQGCHIDLPPPDAVSASPQVNPHNMGGARNDENSNQFDHPAIAGLPSNPFSSADRGLSPGFHSSSSETSSANSTPIPPPLSEFAPSPNGHNVSDYNDDPAENQDVDRPTLVPDCANDQERQPQLLEQDERNPPSSVLGPARYDESEVILCDKFCCPLCNYQTEIPLNENKKKISDKLLNDFINIPLQNIEHFQTMQDELPRGKNTCANCDNVATSVCCYRIVCNYRPLCVNCQHPHLQQAKARGETGHTITDVGNSWEWAGLKRRNEICKVKGNSGVYDQIHNLPKTWYCADHDEVICTLCTARGSVHNRSNNDRCDRVNLCEEVHEDAKRITEQNLRNLESINNRVKEALERTRELKENLQNKCAEKRNSINERYDELKRQLEDQRNALLDNCDNLYKYKSDELQKHHFKLNKIHEPLNRCIKFVRWFKKEALSSEFMMLKTQINQRLEELKNTYRDYQYEPHEDDRIYFEQSEFDVPNEAIGHIYSTPSVRKFSLEKKGRRKSSVHNPVIISVVPRDAIDNDVSHLLDLREIKLEVTLEHIDSNQSTKGCFIKDSKTGSLYATVCPSQTGKHQLRIYEQLKLPYNDGGNEQKEKLDVNDSDFLKSLGHQVVLALERVGKAIIDSEP